MEFNSSALLYISIGIIFMVGGLVWYLLKRPYVYRR